MPVGLRAKASEAEGRDVALDGLRGVAIATVVVGHGFAIAQGSIWRDTYHSVVDAMQIGLDLFFVLSGFLITSILVRTSGKGGYFKNFYARRMLRVFPAYYTVLVTVVFLRPLVFGEPGWHADLQDAAPYYFVYIQNLVMATTGEGLGWVGLFPTFSLAIEEQFYLVWPLLIWLVPRRFLLRACLGLVAASIVFKLLMFATDQGYFAVYMHTLSRLHGLAAGAAVAVWVADGSAKSLPAWLRTGGRAAGVALIGTILLRSIGAISTDTNSVLLNLGAVFFFSWVLVSTVLAPPGAANRRCLECRPLTVLGKYSYGLYLIHFPVLLEFRLAVMPSWGDAIGNDAALLLSGVVAIAASFLAAVLMFHVLEEPFLRLKRFFEPKNAHGSLVGGAAGA